MIRPPLPTEPSRLCGVHTVTDLDLPPATDRDWYLSPELSTLWGTDLWAELDEQSRRRVTRLEAALLASSTVHGEDQVLGGLRPRSGAGEPHDGYLEVFVAEEENHQAMFGAYLDHLGVPLLPTRAVGWTERTLTDAEFYACVLVFEDLVGQYNRHLARDERLHPLARAVNHAHAVEEAQHLRFGRHHVAELLRGLLPSERSDLGEQVASYLRAVWQERYRTDVYALAGLQRPWSVARSAWDAPSQRAARLEATLRALRPFAALDLDPERITR